MSSTVEELTQRIGSAITSALPEAWHEAYVEVVFEEDVITSHGRYRSAPEGVEHSFPLPGSINRLFQQLRVMTRQADQDMWMQARFTIQSNQHFTIELGYAS
ncbi:MAG: hypothetical protein EOM24_15070 [Chloroflexia bacterium]|nr:hypothetical protein [Chloroflexia bacterium]